MNQDTIELGLGLIAASIAFASFSIGWKTFTLTTTSYALALITVMASRLKRIAEKPR